jgi:hypothetical protein
VCSAFDIAVPRDSFPSTSHSLHLRCRRLLQFFVCGHTSYLLHVCLSLTKSCRFSCPVKVMAARTLHPGIAAAEHGHTSLRAFDCELWRAAAVPSTTCSGRPCFGLGCCRAWSFPPLLIQWWRCRAHPLRALNYSCIPTSCAPLSH